MGALVWHDWARLLALASGACTLSSAAARLPPHRKLAHRFFPIFAPPADVAWAALWGFMDRKYFWDFVGGSLGPHGIVYVPMLGARLEIVAGGRLTQLSFGTTGASVQAASSCERLRSAHCRCTCLPDRQPRSSEPQAFREDQHRPLTWLLRCSRSTDCSLSRSNGRPFRR